MTERIGILYVQPEAECIYNVTNAAIGSGSKVHTTGAVDFVERWLTKWELLLNKGRHATNKFNTDYLASKEQHPEFNQKTFDVPSHGNNLRNRCVKMNEDDDGMEDLEMGLTVAVLQMTKDNITRWLPMVPIPLYKHTLVAFCRAHGITDMEVAFQKIIKVYSMNGTVIKNGDLTTTKEPNAGTLVVPTEDADIKTVDTGNMMVDPGNMLTTMDDAQAPFDLTSAQGLAAYLAYKAEEM